MIVLKRGNLISASNALILMLLILNVILLKDNLNIKKRIYEKKYYPVFKRMLELQLEEGKRLNKNVQFIDSNKNKIYLKDIIISEPKIILYYNDKICYPCVNEIVTMLESKIDSFKYIEKNLLIISDDYSSYSSHNLQTRFKNYKIIQDKLGFKNENLDEPFLFIIDSTYVSRMYIIPNFHESNSIDEYLEFLKTSYFTKNPIH
jgi:hypothetical protein